MVLYSFTTMQTYVVLLLLAGFWGAQASINSNAYGKPQNYYVSHKQKLRELTELEKRMSAASPPKIIHSTDSSSRLAKASL